MRMEIRGLTLIRPWGWCIAQGHKPVENRTWKPPAALIGAYLAIHNGQKYDEDAAHGIWADHDLTVPSAKEDLPGRIIAVARLAGVTHEDEENGDRDSAWFCGPFGWWLEGVVRIEPVACKGAQGLWTLPPLVLQQVRDNYRLAKSIPTPPSPTTP